MSVIIYIKWITLLPLFLLVGIIWKTKTVMECLHHFCMECIDKSMHLGYLICLLIIIVLNSSTEFCCVVSVYVLYSTVCVHIHFNFLKVTCYVCSSCNTVTHTVIGFMQILCKFWLWIESNTKTLGMAFLAILFTECLIRSDLLISTQRTLWRYLILLILESCGDLWNLALFCALVFKF